MSERNIIMNYSNICVILNGYLKLERGLRQTVCLTYSKSFKQESFRNGSIRHLRSYQNLRQAQNDGVTVLPSPQEVIKFFLYIYYIFKSSNKIFSLS